MRSEPLGAVCTPADRQCHGTAWRHPRVCPPAGKAGAARRSSPHVPPARWTAFAVVPLAHCRRGRGSGEKDLGARVLPLSALHPMRGRSGPSIRSDGLDSPRVRPPPITQPNGPQKCIGPSPHMWAALGCSTCGPSNRLGSHEDRTASKDLGRKVLACPLRWTVDAMSSHDATLGHASQPVKP
uniref:Uncharacterized protein n=1 Tax=Oryza meridionalis TaxID=40149 RepID=A0A0E0D6Q9_9ORYZ